MEESVVRWHIRSFLFVTPGIRRVRVTKERLYFKQRKNIRNPKRTVDS
jgi:hypothetical protein